MRNGKDIHGKDIRWIRAFLTDRKRRVLLNGVSSEDVEVLSGVPQS